jgi:hypothetical protein
MRAARYKEKVRKDKCEHVCAEGREHENRDVFSASAPATATWHFVGEAPAVGEEIMPAQAVLPRRRHVGSTELCSGTVFDVGWAACSAAAARGGGGRVGYGRRVA